MTRQDLELWKNFRVAVATGGMVRQLWEQAILSENPDKAVDELWEYLQKEFRVIRILQHRLKTA